MTDPAIRTVSFAIVGPTGGARNAVHVERLPTLDRNANFASAPDFPDVIDMLMDARANDDGATRLDGVMVAFDQRQFDGRSFGLALAIADQRARRPKAPNMPVIATGCVTPRGRGEVAVIESVDEKFAVALAMARECEEEVTFAFPKANWLDLEPPVRIGFERAASAARLHLLPCGTVGDAARLWRSGTVRRRGRAVAVAGILGLLAVGGSAAAWQYHVYQPARDCEMAVSVLPDEHQPARQLAAAARTCQSAADRFPENGRLQFLVGQIRAVDNSPVLAAAAWRRAAELGDPDGMATYGRYVWQQDPARAGEARIWLKRAADKGVSAAAEDLGYLMLEDGSSAAGQAWFAKARIMKAAAEDR